MAMNPVSERLPDLAEKTLSFEYHSGDVTAIEPNHTTGWRTLPGLLTAYITGYEAILRRPGCDDLVVSRRQVLCIPPTVRHRVDVRAWNHGVSCWSHTAYSMFDSLDVFFLLDPPLIISGERAERIGEINRQLTALIRSAESDFHAIVRRKALGFELLSVVAELSAIRPRGLEILTGAKRLARVLSRMARSLSEPLHVPALAAMAGMSVSRFYAAFKDVLGVSPARYVRDLRLKKAQQLLIAGDLPVKVVASRVGYSDEFHFSHLFKKYCGVCPSEYAAAVKPFP